MKAWLRGRGEGEQRVSKDLQVDGLTPEVAYYYPEWHWHPDEHGWVKSLLLFFDEIALLVPDYKRHQPANMDPELAGALEDANLLRIIEPEWFVDAEMTGMLAEAMVAIIDAERSTTCPHRSRSPSCQCLALASPASGKSRNEWSAC